MKKGKIVSGMVLFFFIIFNVGSCIKSDTRDTSTVAPLCSGTPGPLFTAVKTLVNKKCVSCHSSVITNGGMNFSIECNIVISELRIKARAVDEGSMPPTGTLPQADKNTITAWLNAGGKYTD